MKDYNNLFNHNGEAEIHRRIYIRQPDKIDSIKNLEYYNRNASEAIAEAEKAIEVLKEYQQALFHRYQEILQANFKMLLRLERVVSYSGAKSYVITISKRFDGSNIADEIISKETFPGKERHNALKRFEALKKEHPNIETEIDIAKKQWER